MSNLDNFFDNTNNIHEFSVKYIAYLNRVLNNIQTDEISNFTDILLEARKKNATIYFIGNGGSASTASHFATDLAIGTRLLDNPFKAISLTDNNSIITSIGNDFSFEDIFYQQVKINLKKDDVLVAISASGNSANLIKAIKYANSAGGITCGITSFNGGELKNIAHHSLHVPTELNEYGPAEDGHLIINHIVCNYLLKFLKNNS